MVYCGTPSKGCASCRSKRTKCDQKQPSCGQCLKAGRECPGYRDVQALMFKDETRKVKRKAHAREARDGNTINETIVGRVRPDKEAGPVDMSKSLVVTQSLAVPLEDQAISYFYHHWAPVDSAYERSYIQKVKNLGLTGNALPGLVAAIGMGSISSTRNDPQMMLLARKRYTEVLPVLTANLQDPVLWTASSTLMAVLLSGLFEAVTCSSPGSLQSWAKHVHGALTIVELRGPDQLKNEIDRNMVHNLRLLVMIDALQRRARLPPSIVELSNIAFTYGGATQQTEQKLLAILERLCTLRYITKDTMDSDPSILETAFTIEKELAEWAESVPWEYAFLVKKKKKPDGFLDRYHVYRDAWIVGAWNVYRCGHILTHELIIQWLTQHSSPAKAAAQRRESKVVLDHLAADICYSAPFLIGEEEFQTASNSPKAIGANTLIWPLFLAASMELGEEYVKVWVIEQYEKMGRMFGIKQAISMATVLRMKKAIRVWDKEVMAPIEEEEW